ncbi:uncharacterized protein ACR2FA_011676 [Aphomia sociella]
MPNTRRRRFSVQNDIATRDPSKTQSGSPNRYHDPFDMTNHTPSGMKSSKTKNKTFPNSSKNINTLEIVAECDSTTSLTTVKKQSTSTMDKDVTASSSNIDLCTIPTDKTSPVESKETMYPKDSQNNRDSRTPERDRMQFRRDKHPRQHRIKVRSPRRKISMPDQVKTIESNKRSIGTVAVDWNQEVEIAVIEQVEQINDIDTTVELRLSNHSLDDMCRICHGGEALSSELGSLISACSCRGTVGRVHVKCLERWLTESGKSKCELCGTRYATRRVHKYGVPRALVMWILSQNAKQLMVDSLGIMLMSPLAVLAAWLSGRTLAGLMSQESHVTPWPLASTFVLACMTLVCYYCWIVSAATRHALGWWIWYRSQYEVRLQFQDNEE